MLKGVKAFIVVWVTVDKHCQTDRGQRKRRPYLDCRWLREQDHFYHHGQRFSKRIPYFPPPLISTVGAEKVAVNAPLGCKRLSPHVPPTFCFPLLTWRLTKRSISKNKPLVFPDEDLHANAKRFWYLMCSSESQNTAKSASNVEFARAYMRIRRQLLCKSGMYQEKCYQNGYIVYFAHRHTVAGHPAMDNDAMNKKIEKQSDRSITIGTMIAKSIALL